jgi:hypothetical protein
MKRKIFKFFVNNWLTILLAFVPPIVVTYYFQREVRQLDIVLKSNTPVVQIEEQYSDEIAVFYKTNKIEALNVIELVVKNSGNRPIESDDFKRPLIFTFNGTVLPNPRLIDVTPKAIEPNLIQIEPNSLELEPLLLNQGDHFSFLVYLINSKASHSPVEISARISGIKEPRLRIEVDIPTMRNVRAKMLSWIIYTISLTVSLLSILYLWKKAKEATLDLSSFSKDLEILHRPSEIQSAAQRLARQLNISGQDYKANLLLLRIKIEEQLRELANRANISSDLKLSSIIELIRRLADREILSWRIAKGIAAVMPVINRELHASEAYLTKNEFENLQQFTLQLVAEIMRLNNQKEIADEPSKNKS